MKRTLKTLATVGMALLAVLFASHALSAASYTINQDQAFLTVLYHEGVYVPVGQEYVAIGLGHTPADAVATSPTFATFDMEVVTGLRTGNSPHTVATIMFASVYAYQPQYLPLLQVWAESRSSGPPSPVSGGNLGIGGIGTLAGVIR